MKFVKNYMDDVILTSGLFRIIYPRLIVSIYLYFNLFSTLADRRTDTDRRTNIHSNFVRGGINTGFGMIPRLILRLVKVSHSWDSVNRPEKFALLLQ